MNRETNKPGNIMKHSLAALVALTALISSTGAIYAQDDSTPPEHAGRPPRHAGPGAGEGRRQHGPPIVAALDVNKDGTLDATELANAPAVLKALDKNGDGQLTREELGPVPPPHAPRPPRAPAPPAGSSDQPAAPTGEQAPPPGPVMPLIKALDVNGDGVLDAQEMANATTALLALDQNNDGQLTPDEHRPAPLHAGHPGAGKGQHPHGPRGGQPPVAPDAQQ
jgi:hypothetical protein